MIDYEFTLKFEASGEDTQSEAILDALYEAGCDDALVGIGVPGRLSLSFIREAVNAKAAVLSAVASVRSAIPAARLTEVSPDLVGLTELAELLGCTRQNIRKYAVGEIQRDAPFPSPAFTGKTALWHLALIGDWINRFTDFEFDESLLEVARVAMAINTLRDMEQESAELLDEIRDAVFRAA